MELELVMYTIRKLLERESYAVFATYPPKDGACFDSSVGDDYHNFIMFTQAIEATTISGSVRRFYLYYRNKRTHGFPEFSSCEFGMFTGSQFVSLFKEHIEQLSEPEFAQIIVNKIKNSIESI